MGSGSGLDPFSPSAGLCIAEQGLLGSVLSLCEDAIGGAEPLSPWAKEGGYGRAPGFEREDQVRRTDTDTGEHRHYRILIKEINYLLYIIIVTMLLLHVVITLILFVVSGQAKEFCPRAA